MKKGALALALFLAVAPLSALAGDAGKGKEIYDKRCWWCHGEQGAGDGPAAESLNPPPRDFTSGVYKWKTTPFDEMAPTNDDFAKMIKGGMTHNSIAGWTGMNGTSMPGWADMLSDNDVSDLTAYIMKFAELGQPQKKPVNASKGPSASKESLERGKKIFQDRCSECHGEEGRGDGAKKLKDDSGFRTWPRNLSKGWTFRVSNDPKDIYARVTVGIPGTQMPSFADPANTKKLTDDERWDVANYVSSLDAPHKKPGDNTVINAKRLDGELPENPVDPSWGQAQYTSFYLVPQLIAEKRHFTPSLDSISVKALFNDKELAILIEWDDRTRSLPGNAKAMEIADGDLFEDAVAVQWPVKLPEEGEKPYFGMGDASLPVNIWYWKSEPSSALHQVVKLLNARGFKDVEERDPATAGLKASGIYEKGVWRVVMKRPLAGGDAEKDIQFAQGRYIPVAFAAWDGSNQEKGPKHEMTTWQWILLQPETSSAIYTWPVGVALMILGLEVIWLKLARRKKETGPK